VFYDGQSPGWQSVLHTARATLAAHYVHNVAWYNDPDVLCVREPLTIDHARMLCTIVGLTGQVLFLGDILYDLPPERVWMLQRLMPVCDVYPGHLAACDWLPEVWSLTIRRPFEQWNVVALFNWNEQADKTIETSLEDLHLCGDRKYLVYDFWEGQFLGSVAARLRIRLKPQSCKLVAVRELRPYPQLVSVDRHISQGGVCVREANWDERAGAFRARMDLPARETFAATVHVPAGYHLAKVTGRAEVEAKKARAVRLRVRKGQWGCVFSRRKQ
jgi:hypothetical protein